MFVNAIRCYVCCLAPTAPPENIQGHNTSETSLFLSWEHVPESMKNGIITGYVAVYQKENGSPKQIEIIGSEKFNTSLVGLDWFTKYTIKVAASTVAGAGVAGNLTVYTDEWSKFSFTVSCFLYIGPTSY